MIPLMTPQELAMTVMMENCALKAMISAIVGAVLGVGMAVFTTSMDPSFAISKDPSKPVNFLKFFFSIGFFIADFARHMDGITDPNA